MLSMGLHVFTAHVCVYIDVCVCGGIVFRVSGDSNGT